MKKEKRLKMTRLISLSFLTGIMAALALMTTGCGNSLEKEYAIVREIQKEGNSTRMEELTPEKIAGAGFDSERNHLIELRLSNQNMVKVSPKIGQLKYLVNLYLEGNLLSDIPPEVCTLKRLKKITLSSNKLAGLPPAFSQLDSLKELWLNENSFSSFPAQITQLKALVDLRLQNNSISAIPASLIGMDALQNINLSNNSICIIDPDMKQWISTRSGEHWLETQHCH